VVEFLADSTVFRNNRLRCSLYSFKLKLPIKTDRADRRVFKFWNAIYRIPSFCKENFPYLRCVSVYPIACELTGLAGSRRLGNDTFPLLGSMREKKVFQDISSLCGRTLIFLVLYSYNSYKHIHKIKIWNGNSALRPGNKRHGERERDDLEREMPCKGLVVAKNKHSEKELEETK